MSKKFIKNTNLQPLVGEISWAKHLVVLATGPDQIRYLLGDLSA